MFKSAKFFTVVGFLLIIALVGGLYLSSKNAANQEPIKIYKATPTTRTQDSKVTAPKTSPSEREARPSTIVSTPREHVHEHAPHEHSSYGGDDFSHLNESEIEVPLSERIPLSERSEEPTSKEPIDEVFDSSEWLHEQMETLAALIQVKYPELLELQHMTLEEMDALSNEEKTRINQLSHQFQSEYMGEIRDLFSQLPPAHLESVLTTLRETYAKQWGAAFADRIVEEMRAHLE